MAAMQMVLRPRFAAIHFRRATGNRLMRVKMFAVVVLLVVSAALFVEMRKENRADAAASNCYSDAKGPSAPTLCN
jgi:hypothetical protein